MSALPLTSTESWPDSPMDDRVSAQPQLSVLLNLVVSLSLEHHRTNTDDSYHITYRGIPQYPLLVLHR